VSFLPGAVYVQASNPSAPIPSDPGRYGLDIWLTSEDDPSLPTWSLTDGEENGLVLMPGVRGLGKPDSTAFAEEYAAIDGEYYFGERTHAREIFLPLYVYHEGDSSDWVMRDQLLWRNFRRGHHSRLHTYHPAVGHRSLRARYTSGGGEALELDPTFFGWAKYGIYLKAAQPFYEGDPIEYSWAAQTPKPMYGVGFGAPPLNVSYRNIETATLSNPGEMEVAPKVILEGPMDDGAVVTIGGKAIPVPFALLDGDVLVIDHAKSAQSAILNGSVDRTDDLGSFRFAMIPAGQNIPIGLNIPGSTGKVTVSLTPLYERAW
jgi:hypothetical protein